jgi:HEAT repeat protein
VPVRNKLIVAAVAANLGGMIAAVYLAKLIREVPATASTETMLLAGYYTAMCLVAVVDALLIDEFLFGGSFRLTHLQGKDPKFARASDDEAMVAATMQRSSVSFPIVLLLAGGLTYLLFNIVNNDFNSYYRRVGIHVSSLRGDEPESQPRRLQAIAELSVRRDPTIVPILREQLARGGEVGAWAAWALGRFGDVTSERKAILGDLRATLRSTPDPALRREALVSLARYQDREVADALVRELERDLEAGVIDRRLLIAAGYIQVPKVLPVLGQILQRGDEKAQRVAAWAIAQHRDQRDAKDLDVTLADRLPSAAFPVRCAIVFSLGILGHERAYMGIIHEL